MDDDSHAEPPAAPAASPPPGTPLYVRAEPKTPTEARLRRIAGRNEKRSYQGPIVAIARGWVSRDVRPHWIAARFMDFALITEEHLVLCSTGFFTRWPRRSVLREPLDRITVVRSGRHPERTLRIVGEFHKPILIELKDDDGATFARELLIRTQPTIGAAEAAQPLPPAPESAS